MAEFERLVRTFEKESATICECCGGDGVLSRTAARMPWYAVRCDECREAGWIVRVGVTGSRPPGGELSSFQEFQKFQMFCR